MIKKEKLLKTYGALSYLGVVFLNAFTDLGHKIIIQNTIFKVYDDQMQIVLTAIVNALILLPFLLVFSPAGFLADKFAKNKIMRHSALFAVLITLLITYAYYHGLFLMAFVLTFVLALQSAIYGPAKYGYIKELFGESNISAANAAVQGVTTVAILGGIIFYSLLFEGLFRDNLVSEAEILRAIAPLGWLLVIGSLIEWYLSFKLPNRIKEQSKRLFRLKRYLSGAYLRKNLKTIWRKREIFDAIISLSIFWSISQVVLAIFGEYAKSNLGVTNTVFVQGVMALAGVGIVLGAYMAANYSRYFVNMGLVVIGAFGLSIVVFLVPFVGSMALFAFLFTLLGIFSAFIMVPLSAQIQLLSPRVHLGTILAGSNFIQTLFMFSFLLLTTFFAYFGLSAQKLFYLMTLLGIYLFVSTLMRYGVDAYWAMAEIVMRVRHRYIYHGLENIPKSGAVLLMANHVSWVDWIVLQIPLKRKIHYMMDKAIYNWPFFHYFFKKGGCIALSPRGLKDAFFDAHSELLDGNIVGIFPEGAISKDGEIGKIYRGYEMIPPDYEGVIVVAFIDGLFGSLFARNKAGNKASLLKRREVNVYFFQVLPTQTKHQEIKDILINMKEKYEQR